MQNYSLERLEHWVESHGNVAYIENGQLVIETQCMNRNGACYIERESVKTMAQARKILGY